MEGIERGKKKKDKKIKGAEHIYRIRDYKSSRYFSRKLIFVKNMIFYESSF